MLGLLKKLFGGKPAEATQPEAAPYKIETAPVVETVKVETAPVADFYKAQGKFVAIEGSGEIDEISNRLFDSIDAHL